MRITFPKELEVRRNIRLKDYNSIHVGGPADYLAEVTTQTDLINLYRYCLEREIRMLAIGDGTNVFFSEKGFRGLVAVIRFGRIEQLGENCIRAESGAQFSELNRFCLEHSLTGCEFSSGIPGTVGGAIYGNAGAYGKNIGQCLSSAKILTADGKVKSVSNDYLEFSYRSSRLKRHPAIVLEAEFQFEPGDYAEIKKRIDDIVEIRRSKLPPETVRTAGSYFKNLKDDLGNPIAAATYLDAVGSKQASVGDAAVHIKHANIFYNKGRATAQDVLKLEEMLRELVYEKFGVRLEREVMYFE